MTPRKRTLGKALSDTESKIFDVSFSPDGKTIAAAYGHYPDIGAVVLWNVVTHEEIGGDPLPVSEGVATHVAFSPDGKTIAAAYSIGDFGGGVVLFNGTTRNRLFTKPLSVREGNILRVTFSPDSKTIAVAEAGGEDSGVVLWDVVTQKPLDERPLRVKEGRVSDVIFTPDGRKIAVAYRGDDSGGGVAVWDVAERKRLDGESFHVKEGNVHGLACRCIPDGKTIIAAAYNGINQPFRGISTCSGIVLWDVTTHTRFVGEPLEEGVEKLAFSPDGTTLAAGCRGGVVLLDVDLKSWQHRAAQIANRNFTRDEWSQYFPDKAYRQTFLDLPEGKGVTEARRLQQAPLVKAPSATPAVSLAR